MSCSPATVLHRVVGIGALALFIASCAGVRELPPRDPRLDEVVGTYLLAPEDPVLVTPSAAGGLRIYRVASAVSARANVLTSEALQPAGADRYGSVDEGVELLRDASGSITGLRLHRAGADVGEATRSMEPTYRVLEVGYRNGDVDLSGTLLAPTGEVRAGVVFIHGSGASDRDNLWYLIIAHALASREIAVLLPDKRGTGKSGGDWTIASFEDFAADARAGLEPLRDSAAIPEGAIGFLGVSQGGWIAPLAAARDSSVGFVVNLSGAATTPNRQLAHEIAQDMRGLPFPIRALGVVVAKARRPRWWWKNGGFDPLPFWCRLQRPSLTVLGRDDERDNVPVHRSLERLDELRTIAPEIEVRVYEGVGHGLADPAGRLHPGFLTELVDWVGARAAPTVVPGHDRDASCRLLHGP